MSRREIREHIFKLLFLLEFYKGEELNEQAERYLDEVEEAVPTEEEAAYIRERFHKIEAQITELDQNGKELRKYVKKNEEIATECLKHQRGRWNTDSPSLEKRLLQKSVSTPKNKKL